ncbi:hypothetical protein COLO4_20909 [Corchorus olitorius]|uniref:Uncharacterized protein n=1 Tax=Corchorus olitorius TaxID=93759 RepID=A0A1R3IWC2_9ROSI|nr:hypothetical protein COLO4_20909 [Corchorus olitorius]
MERGTKKPFFRSNFHTIVNELRPDFIVIKEI